MLATLVKPVRDNCGCWHKVGEQVAPVSTAKRAEFDARLLINVVFEDGAHGALFCDEIQLRIPLLDPDSMRLLGPL